MEKGLSIHIGLNFVSKVHYNNWDGRLKAAEFDMDDMFDIAKSQGFSAIKLRREEATRESVKQAISNAAHQLSSGDILLITYSGHGGQVPDAHKEEPDALDETWCLYNGQLIDDELNYLWTEFAEGVRILVISDSCHSGSVIKMHQLNKMYELKTKPVSKNMPINVCQKTYLSNMKFYDKLQADYKPIDLNNIHASVKLISGCRDDEYSYDGDTNGQFTGSLREVWANGKFNGHYPTFLEEISANLSAQHPEILDIGSPNSSFENQKPFTI
jgi:hypothetical protein